MGSEWRPEFPLTDELLRTYKVASVTQDFKDKVNSISFSNDGSVLACSSDDDTIVLWDAVKGTTTMTIPCKRYGADHVTYTHSNHGVIHSSRKGDGPDSIRYLNVREVKYERVFTGHTKRVTGLMMAPLDDHFLSVSEDKFIKLWDLKCRDSVGQLEASARPVGAFDPDGLIFAIGYKETVHLYDFRMYEKGPFVSAILPREASCDWTGMQFSDDGAYVLISTNGSVIRMIDSFDGQPKVTLAGHQNRGLALEASFSPDSKYVFGGSSDGKVHCWNAKTGNKVPALSTHLHPGPVTCVKMSPRHHTLASACSVLCVWIPDMTRSNF